MPDMSWLPNPPDGTEVCLGFDGSDVDDWTAIRAETFEGFQFTPRIFAGSKPSIWNPAESFDHRIPRAEVHAAVDELFDRFKVVRFYYDPPGWQTEGEGWQLKHGEAVLPFETYRPTAMYHALERFVMDLKSGMLTHDGCPDTARHIGSAVKTGRGRDMYGVAKASRLQKIDAAVTSVLAHEAASDARAAGWGQLKSRLTRVTGRVSGR
jgi:hypothetical protein